MSELKVSIQAVGQGRSPDWYDASIDVFLGTALTSELSAVYSLRRVVEETNRADPERKKLLLSIIDEKILEMNTLSARKKEDAAPKAAKKG